MAMDKKTMLLIYNPRAGKSLGRPKPKEILETLNQYADASPEQILAEVHESVNRFVKDAEQFDDMTMLCLKYNGTAKQPAETPKTENGQKG